MTWAELFGRGKELLRDAGVAEYELDAWYLFSEAFHISRTQYFLLAREEAAAEKERLSLYEEYLRRRSAREPLQYILKSQEFMGLQFEVNEDVLIPRQDTETLVEEVLKVCKNQKSRMLDMCTGSGCIAVSLAAFGGYEVVEAADLSEAALTVAGRNVCRLLGGGETGCKAEAENAVHGARTEREADNETRRGKSPAAERESEVFGSNPEIFRYDLADGRQVILRHSDLFSAFGPEELYDGIVSNPPYIPRAEIEKLEPEVREFEPKTALDGAEDGLFFYRRLAEECGRHLKPGGRVFFEIGYDQGEAVEKLLKAHGFCERKVIKDLTGKDRVVTAVWPAGSKEEVSHV